MFTIEDIARATGGKISGNGPAAVVGVSTDSRTVGEGELFIPLKGASFDGHDFIAAAAGRGVRVFVAEGAREKDVRSVAGAVCITVEDTLRALGDLAAFHRSRFDIPVVGVTGSNGKTTTKEMLGAILSLTGQGLKTTGNLNNLIGLPQMLLRLSHHDRWAVLEMGMSEPGEIDRLAEMARPKVGIITNAFPAHLETMGSVEAVARAKGELFLRLPEGGTAVYNADDSLISGQPSPEGVKRLSFGLSSGDVTAEGIAVEGTEGQRFVLRLPQGAYGMTLKAFGRHNVANALAAASAAIALGIDPETIRKGLEAFTPYDKRFQLEEVNGIVLIDDSYNANPASMEAALVTVRDLKGANRAVAVLGDMLELGADAEKNHADLGVQVASCAEQLVATGAMAGLVADGARAAGMPAASIFIAGDHDEVFARLRSVIKRGDFVLVKGSRGMRMEKIAEALRNGRIVLPGGEVT